MSETQVEPGLVVQPEARWAPQVDEERLEELKGLPDSQIKKLALRARKQLYFMAKGVMGYKDLTVATHGAFCKFVQNEEWDRKLQLMPRGTLKSSIATEADSVRIACDQPDNARILIINEVLDNSKAFLATIRAQFEKNKFLQTLFPHLIHSRFSGPGIDWSGQSATLPRSTSYKEPTWLPLGVGGAATSKHFSHIKVDDMIGLEAKKSPAVLKAAINWNRNIESLSIDAFSTVIEWTGTRWGRNDAYQDIIDRYKLAESGGDLHVFTRSMLNKNGEILYPEKFDWRFLRRIMEETPDIWSAQYMNDPTSEMTLDFSEADLKYFKFDNDGNVRFWRDKVLQKWHWTDLDRVLTVDPNGGSKTAPDEAALVVTGQAPDEDVFALKAKSSRWTPDEFIDEIFEAAVRWRPRVVVIEKAGQQNTRFYFEKKMRKEGLYFHVEDGKHGNVNKEDRIRTALEPILASRQLFVLASQTTLIHQIKNYPDVKNDDQIDALSYAPKYWRKPQSTEENATNTKVVKMLLNRRNPTTGYGSQPATPR
jgi:phage terminase large subunit-like protein